MNLKSVQYRTVVLMILIVAMGSGCMTPLWAIRAAPANASVPDEAVILVHGLGRSYRSMSWIQRELQHSGYRVVNVDYPSLKWSIEAAADQAVAKAVAACRFQGAQRIHFVTHSMGGLVVRQYLQDNELPAGSRVVMLAPPNSGSEVMDWAQTRISLFPQLAGPAAAQLVTSPDALHGRMRPVAPTVGVIAGRGSWNPFFSALIPGEDDGKVAVQRTRLSEMKDFIVVEANHTTLLLDVQVRGQVLAFLQSGQFCCQEAF